MVAFAFIQPHLPGQADPNLCAVDPATGIQYRNIAPGQDGFIWGSNSIGQDLWARIWAGARTSLTIAFFVALIEAVVGITAGVLWGYVRGLDFVFTELYNIFDNIPTAIVLILISYVATPSIWTMVLGMAIKGWIEMARFIRNQILIIRDRDYNVASRCIGTPTIRIVLRNLLPYLVSVIMLRMALTIPEAIGNEVFITYIGLGLVGGDALAGQSGQRWPQGDDAGRAALPAAVPHPHPELCHHCVLSDRQRLLGRRRPEEPSAVRRGYHGTSTSSFSPQKMSTSSSTCVEKMLHAIRGIDLDLYQGEVLAIVGESGSGKSVFTKSFMGLLDANGSITGGTIDYYGMADGKPLRLSDLKTEKDWLRVRGREIAMVMQDPMTSLNPLKTIGAQIMEAVALHQGLKGAAAKGKDAGIPAGCGHLGPGKALSAVPARVLRRHAPAGGDRHCGGLQPQNPDLRRAHHRTGRDHSGPDLAAARRKCRFKYDLTIVHDHPRSGRCGQHCRPRGCDVRRRHRGDRHC